MQAADCVCDSCCAGTCSLAADPTPPVTGDQCSAAALNWVGDASKAALAYNYTEATCNYGSKHLSCSMFEVAALLVQQKGCNPVSLQQQFMHSSAIDQALSSSKHCKCHLVVNANRDIRLLFASRSFCCVTTNNKQYSSQLESGCLVLVLRSTSAG